jgi:hypothetical protein
MSLAFAIYYSIAIEGVQGFPVNSSEEVPNPPNTISFRTKYGILWSCLLIIFSCTWLAVHPNVPNPDSPKWQRLLCRVQLMVIALIAPETIILWAMHQWMAAYKLRKKYQQGAFVSVLANNLLFLLMLRYLDRRSIRMDAVSRIFCYYGRLYDLRIE